MDTKKVTFIPLKDRERPEAPIVKAKQRQANTHPGITTPYDDQLLMKIAKCNIKKEALLLKTGEMENKIHEIYERFADSWEYGKILEHHDFDIDWLSDLLDTENYDKLEEYLMYYCSKNDEVLFHLGFKYTWNLFTECAKKEASEESRKSKSDPVSLK